MPADNPTLPLPAADLRIPGYDLLGEIARGGMGVVYRAHDLTLDREVAIKTLIPGRSDGETPARRFETEARVTARLPHPGVPPAYALGRLADGRPFLAMKLIRGKTLADLLAARESPAEGLPRFVQVFEAVCQAVGFAHSRGVVHRDLKPSNVMVGEFGEVQVMDWGLAKTEDRGQKAEDRAEAEPRFAATRGGAREPLAPAAERDTLPLPEGGTDDGRTRAGAVMGTPAYMAPEQARGEPLDPRADVFALGGILCSVLTGEPPYGWAEPAVLVFRAQEGLLADAVARLDACGADAELVSLAKRCLAASRDDRPADGGAVAALVAAYRTGVEDRLQRAKQEAAAAEATAREQVKRRRVALRLGSGIIGALLIGGVVSAWQAVRATNAAEAEGKARIEEGKARDAEHEAAELAIKREGEAKEALKAEAKAKAEALEREKEERKAKEKERTARLTSDEVAKFMQVIFAGEGTTGEAGRNRNFNKKRTVLEAMDAAAGKIEGKFGDRPEVEAEVRNTIGWTYLEIGALDQARAQLERSLRLREAALGPDHPDTLAGVNGLAILFRLKGDFAAAEPLFRRALLASEAANGPDHKNTLAALGNLAGLLHLRGDPAAAEPLYRRALAGQERVLGPDHPDTLATLHDLAFLLQGKGELAEAEALYRRAADGTERARGPNHPDTLRTLGNLAGCLHQRGELPEAEALFRRVLAAFDKALGPDHPDTLTTLHDLAGLLETKREYGEAEPLYRRALAGREKVLGPDHPGTLATANNLAYLLKAKGDTVAAEPLYRRALAGREKVLGPDHPDTLTTANNLAALLLAKGELPGAEAMFRQVLAGREKALGPDHPDTLVAANNLAMLLRRRGRSEEAEPLLRRAVAGHDRVPGPDHPDTLSLVTNLALALDELGRYGEAEPLYRRALAGREKVLGPDHPHTTATANAFALHLYLRGRYDEAEPLYRRALAAFERAHGPTDPRTVTAAYNLGALYFDTRRYAAAVPLFEKAVRAAGGRAELATAAALSRCLLGLSLLRLDRAAEAEPHLLVGFEWLSKQPTLADRNRNRMRWVTAGLVEVYEKTGRPEKAAEWRSKLAALPPEVAPPPHVVRFPAPMPREVMR